MLSVVQGLTLGVLSVLLLHLLQRVFSRTALDNVPGPPPASFWHGHFSQIFSRHGWNFHRELGEKYGSVVGLNGFLGRKMLYVYDPKAMHHICVKEQNIYEEPDGFLVANQIMFGDGLLSTSGDIHRQQRKVLTPVFSIQHMRTMLPIFNGVTERLKSALMNLVEEHPQREIDLSRWMSRTALELIGQAGLGHSFDPLIEEIPNMFAAAIKALPSALFDLEPFREIIPYVYKAFPHSWLQWMAQHSPFKCVRHAWEIADTMWSSAVNLLEAKKRAIAAGDETISHQIGEGKDLLSILLRENSKANDQDRMTDAELIGHITTFTFAATDTTSSALTRTLYVLAAHPEAQAKLRQELKDARADGAELSYDALVSLPYLDAVCRETLRVFAPVPFMTRMAKKDTVLPLYEPIKGKDGQVIDEIPIPANTVVLVGIMASNRTQTLWGEDALQWKPERWLSPLPDTVLAARIPGVYSHLMTFFAGSRACIGFKFSQLEMKVVLAMLVESFTFELPQDKEIYWNVAGIIYPTVGDVDAQMQLPLQVSLAK